MSMVVERLIASIEIACQQRANSAVSDERGATHNAELWNQRTAATLADIRTALTACVAEWRPITDEQCDGRTYIVGCDMGTWGFVRGYGYFAGKPGSFVSGWVCRGFTDPPGELGLGHPTHYQPLPPPPTEGETK